MNFTIISSLSQENAGNVKKKTAILRRPKTLFQLSMSFSTLALDLSKGKKLPRFKRSKRHIEELLRFCLLAFENYQH
jgi:hypothetical protein